VTCKISATYRIRLNKESNTYFSGIPD